MKAENYLKGILAGASLMYFLDPDRGRRRRGEVRNRLSRLKRKLTEGIDAAARDAKNRSAGLAARARHTFGDDEVADDGVVEARVRSRMGRVVSRPSSVDVAVDEGRVTLTGPVLAEEVDALLSSTRSVPGVDEVVDRLEPHERAGDTPGLQGDGVRPGERSELRQENWTPALRLLAGTVGAATLAGGRRASGLPGAAMSLVGGALVARAATNLPARRLTGLDGGREAVRFQKTIHVDAPVEEVWELWSRFETFPRFMSHLEEVREIGDGRSRWVARGPAGTRFAWNAEVTRWEPRETIAWESEEGATVANAGVVQFRPDPAGGTRLTVHLSYNPPAGAVGHAVASLFGSDPRRAMNEDMVRLKSILEHGKAGVHGETVRREELEAS